MARWDLIDYNNIQKPVTISRDKPRVSVTMRWGGERPGGQIAMWVRRVGEPQFFASYVPVEESGGLLLFQLDDLTFSLPYGRFEGSIQIAGVTYGSIRMQYNDPYQLLRVENPQCSYPQ